MTQISILPPNSTPLERALEATFAARLDALPLPVGQMMNPATCPAAFLPWLAWALSVDEWSPEWTEQTQRAAIAASIGVHRRKGTVAALRAAIAAAGYGEVEVVERYALVRHDGTRRHNGGNDNYAIGADDFGNPAFWAQTQTVGGVTFNQITVDASPLTGKPRMIFDLTGMLTSTTASIGYVSTASQSVGNVGAVWTASALFSVLGPAGGGAGAAQLGTGVRMFNFQNGGGNVLGNLVLAGDDVSIATRTLSLAAPVRCGIQVVGAIGTPINARVAIEGLQFELGAARGELLNQPFTHGSPDHWAEYRLKITRPVTIAQAEQIRRIAAGVAPARCHLKEITYQAAQHLHNGAIVHDGTFAHGSA